MHDDTVQRAALVALLQRRGARWADITSDILEGDSPADLLRAQLGDADTLFPIGNIDELIEHAAGQIAGWVAEGLGFHTFLDEDYPAQLRDIMQMPPVLFARGTAAPDDRAIAVVGTRQASERGLRIATEVAGRLARQRITIVSGLAAGIDTAAHRAALGAGGRTVAVIGTGIRRYYPAQNRPLQDEIAAKGLLLSQFWPDAPPAKQNFPMRNAVMSGYAAATIVVEAPWRSGARIQARLALQHGRPVVMPRELLEHDWARTFAENPGVHVVSSPRELLDVAEELINAMSPAPDLSTGIPGLANA